MDINLRGAFFTMKHGCAAMVASGGGAFVALSSIGYHDYEGIALNDEEKPRLVADLGGNRGLILRNHGLLTVGTTVCEAFLWMYNLEFACAAQIRAQSGGGELVPIARDVLEGFSRQAAAVAGGFGAHLVWPAWLRSCRPRCPCR